MKTYRRHGCERRHRSFRTLAQCVWPRAAWIAGEGEYATVAWCGVLTVSLHDDYTGAFESKRMIDAGACGGRCIGKHEVIQLAPPELMRIAL